MVKLLQKASHKENGPMSVRKPTIRKAAKADMPSEGQEGPVFGDQSREFASVIIKRDHLQAVEGRALINLTMGSDTAAEALLSLHAYHGLSVSVDTAIAAAKACDTAAMFLMHIPSRHTQTGDERSYIIIDRAYWDAVKASPLGGNGTDQETVATFVTLATEADRLAKAAGQPPFEPRVMLSE